MRIVNIALCAALIALLVGTAHAQEKTGAILLQPESDMDRELADDLTEVLIAAVIEKSNRSFRIQGKESFEKSLMDTKTEDGQLCLADRECVRKTGKKMKLQLLVLGKVGKAMGGYRLEVWKLSVSDIPDAAPYRKRVPGDLEMLIEEVESLADWVLRAEESQLTINLLPADAAVTMDDNPVTYEGKPLTVKPGDHVLKATKDGFESGEAKVTCPTGDKCSAKLHLKAKEVVKPDGNGTIVKPDGDKKVKKMSSGSAAGIAVLGVVAVGCAGGAIATGVIMNNAEDDIISYKNEQCPNDKCGVTQSEFDAYVDPLVEKGERAASWTNILWGASAATAVGAGIWLIVELANGPVKEPKKTTLAPAVGPDFSGFTLGVTF